MLLVLATLVAAAIPLQDLMNVQSGVEYTQQELQDIAQVLANQRLVLQTAEAAVKNAQSGLYLGYNALKNGICNFIGFCSSNPAYSCDDIMQQPGVNAADLPNGLYWLSSYRNELPAYIGNVSERVECFFYNGQGWTLLFDDSEEDEVRQKVSSRIMQYRKFTEMLAYTPFAIQNGLPPVQQLVYYVDQAHLDITPAYSYANLMGNAWAGQDQDAAQANMTGWYPNGTQHFRFKYFGKQPSSGPYNETIFVLDDGDISDPICKLQINTTRCNIDFECSRVNGTLTITGRVAQTVLPRTRGGIISFGCSVQNDAFTRCGTCTYSGPYTNPSKAALIQEKVIQKMYVR